MEQEKLSWRWRARRRASAEEHSRDGVGGVNDLEDRRGSPHGGRRPDRGRDEALSLKTLRARAAALDALGTWGVSFAALAETLTPWQTTTP